MSLYQSVKKNRKKRTNANKNMRTYLLCIKKGVSLVDEKITKK